VALVPGRLVRWRMEYYETGSASCASGRNKVAPPLRLWLHPAVSFVADDAGFRRGLSAQVCG